MAKAKPGSLTFGSTGNGSGAHLAGELFKTKAGIDMLHVPFKGLSPMLTELLADRIDLSIAPLPGLIGQQIETGPARARRCARRTLTATPERADVRRRRRRGRRGGRLVGVVRAGQDAAEVVNRLYRAVAAALSKDAVRAKLAQQGIPIALKSPAEISAMLPGEVEKWAAVIKLANVTVD